MLDRVSRAIKAVGRAARARTGKTACEGVPQRATGKRSNFRLKKYWRKLAKTKFGTEIPIVEITIAAVSCHWFLLMAANGSKKNPAGDGKAESKETERG